MNTEVFVRDIYIMNVILADNQEPRGGAHDSVRVLQAGLILRHRDAAEHSGHSEGEERQTAGKGLRVWVQTHLWNSANAE